MADGMRPIAAPSSIAREDLSPKTPSTPGVPGAMVVGTSPLYSCTGRSR